MKHFTNSLKALLAVPVLAFAFATAVPMAAQAVTADCPQGNSVAGGVGAGAKCAQGTGTQSDLFGPTGIFKKITDVLLFIIGAIAVIMLVIGGIRYTISGGDQNSVTAAKNTILYAIVGIIVAILAYAIIGFVTGSFAAPGSS